MTTQRKPSPEVDRGGRVFYVEGGKVYEGSRNGECKGCYFLARECKKQWFACHHRLNGNRGYFTLRPVRAVG